MLVTPHFVFIHIPKTGGRFCRRHIVEFACPVLHRGKLHEPASRMPNQYRKLPIIAFVRNPWDWYVSWYFHMRNFGGFNPLYANTISAGIKEFEPVMHHILDSIENNTQAAAALDAYTESKEYTEMESHDLDKSMIRYQREFNIGMLGWRFCFNIGLAPTVPCHIGRFESLADDLIESMRKCGVSLDDIDCDKIRNTGYVGEGKERAKRDYRKMYTDAHLIERIAEKEQLIIDRFGYCFE